MEKDDLGKLTWICDDCVHLLKTLNLSRRNLKKYKRFCCEFSVVNEKLQNVLEVVDKGISDVKSIVEEMAEGGRAESAVSSLVCAESRSWTEVVKKKKENS